MLFQPEGPVSPQVRAAVYRVMADLPGVTSQGEARDPHGRTGQAFIRDGEVWEGATSSSRVIIDQGTGLPLAVQDFERPGGPVTGYTVLLAATSTDGPPA
ncbi:hypothetical protein [Nonomuraea sp. bgisy101]|uniref:hypothetical protein n=1 Tax=Nonomuraea sp. bgisy101 TaxID=3413784 RepID=UPI003D71C33F